MGQILRSVESRDAFLVGTKMWRYIRCLRDAILVYVPNFVRILSMATDLGALSGIQNGGCQFWSRGLFPVLAFYIHAQFCKCTSTGGWVIAFSGKMQYGGRRHIGFVGSKIVRQDHFLDAIFSLFAKFRANACNDDRVMNVKRNS